MNRLLEKRNTVYGVCAIWIVLFHTFRRIGMPYIPVVTNVIEIGNMGVDVFFFFSGLCLSLSAKQHDYQTSGWRAYYKKRFTRVMIPYLIVCIPYYLWAAIFESSGGALHKVISFLANLSSASFWLKGTQTTWYLYGIVLFYLLFPLLYRFTLRHDWRWNASLLLGLAAFAVLTAHVPLLRKSLIVWARLPVFTIGVMAGECWERKREPYAGERVVAFAVLMLLGWLTSTSGLSAKNSIPSVYRFLLYIPITLALMLLLSKYGRRLSLFDWIGTMSLEVYLIHITLLHPIKYYGIMDAIGYWLYVALPIVSVLIAWVVAQIENIIKQRLSVK